MSQNNIFAGYNLADLAVLLQGRMALPGALATAAAQAPIADFQQQQPQVPHYLLAAATKASSAPAAVATLCARRSAPDPPGNSVEDKPDAAATSGIASAVAAALSRKRPASSPLLTATATGQVQAERPPVAKKARRERSWDEMFGALITYKARRNTTVVPKDFPEDPELGQWCDEQKKKKHEMSADRRYKLDLIGFDWNSAAAIPSPSVHALATLAGLQLATTARAAAPAATVTPRQTANIFEALEQYKQRIHAPPSAASILAHQASNTKQLGLSEAELHWSGMFHKLQAHHTLHGHCNVLLTNHDNPALGLWCLKQRELYQLGTIPAHHKVMLDALGFERDGLIGAAASATANGDAKVEATSLESKERKRVRTFDENFVALLEYKKKHGNVDVPQKYETDRKLGIWVKNVRQHPQRHSEEQRARLDSIGFKWRKLQLDEQWHDAFIQLLEYKDKYGDCNVPSRWKKCPALARWVHTQRTMYRRNKLLDDRKEKLEDAGFVWDCNAMRDDEAFHENYEKLIAFKKARGHCNVPNKYRRDRPLGRWAAKMRDLYCYDQLDADRRKALTDIAFCWKPPIVEPGTAPSGTGEAASQATNSGDESDGTSPECV